MDGLRQSGALGTKLFRTKMSCNFLKISPKMVVSLKNRLQFLLEAPLRRDPIDVPIEPSLNLPL